MRGAGGQRKRREERGGKREEQEEAGKRRERERGERLEVGRSSIGWNSRSNCLVRFQ